MSDEELAAVKKRRAEAEVMLAGEGRQLYEEEARLFDQMEEQRLTHAQRKATLDAHFDRLLGEKR